MPAIINKKIKITPDNNEITITVDFKTLLLCRYKILLKDTKKNEPLQVWRGDNSNDEDDKYCIGTGKENINRTVWMNLTVIDQTGEGGDYEVKLLFEQNGQEISHDTITTGEKSLQPGVNNAAHILVVKMES